METGNSGKLSDECRAANEGESTSRFSPPAANESSVAADGRQTRENRLLGDFLKLLSAVETGQEHFPSFRRKATGHLRFNNI